MTLQIFEQILKDVCPDTFELQAPRNRSRFVVWHRYGTKSGHGDDQNVFDLPKVQIDVLQQDPQDTLADDICSALSAAHLPYTILDYQVYDPDYARLRTIMQLVVI